MIDWGAVATSTPSSTSSISATTTRPPSIARAMSRAVTRNGFCAETFLLIKAPGDVFVNLSWNFYAFLRRNCGVKVVIFHVVLTGSYLQKVSNMRKPQTKEENIHSCFTNLFRYLLLHIYGILGANFPWKFTAFLKMIYKRKYQPFCPDMKVWGAI